MEQDGPKMDDPRTRIRRILRRNIGSLFLMRN